MRRFNRIGARDYEPVRIVGGPKTRAIIQRPPDIDHPGAEFAYPNLTCRVRHDSLLQSGQVVLLPDNNAYLVADHSSTRDWRTHHLFRCDRQVDWTGTVMEIDPVTELERKSSDADKGTLWVVWQRERREFTDLQIRISQENYAVFTGADVQLNDRLDGFKVIRVDTGLGVKVLELQA